HRSLCAGHIEAASSQRPGRADVPASRARRNRPTGGARRSAGRFDESVGAAQHRVHALVRLIHYRFIELADRRSIGMSVERKEENTAAEGKGLRVGLSGKLLLFTALFVMIGEILVFVPSIANYRLAWLSDRLSAAHTAALVL